MCIADWLVHTLGHAVEPFNKPEIKPWAYPQTGCGWLKLFAIVLFVNETPGVFKLH